MPIIPAKPKKVVLEKMMPMTDWTLETPAGLGRVPVERKYKCIHHFKALTRLYHISICILIKTLISKLSVHVHAAQRLH